MGREGDCFPLLCSCSFHKRIADILQPSSLPPPDNYKGMPCSDLDLSSLIPSSDSPINGSQSVVHHLRTSQKEKLWSLLRHTEPEMLGVGPAVYVLTDLPGVSNASMRTTVLTAFSCLFIQMLYFFYSPLLEWKLMKTGNLSVLPRTLHFCGLEKACQ